MGVQTGLMSEQSKMNLEELKKSFPSLEEFSQQKLLGGGYHPGDYWDPNWAGGGAGSHDFTFMMTQASPSDSFLNWSQGQSGKPGANSGGGLLISVTSMMATETWAMQGGVSGAIAVRTMSQEEIPTPVGRKRLGGTWISRLSPNYGVTTHQV